MDISFFDSKECMYVFEQYDCLDRIVIMLDFNIIMGEVVLEDWISC